MIYTMLQYEQVERKFKTFPWTSMNFPVFFLSDVNPVERDQWHELGYNRRQSWGFHKYNSLNLKTENSSELK